MMNTDKTIYEFLDDHYFVKNNLLNDKDHDMTVFPNDVETILLKIFKFNKDITFSTLWSWLYINGMTDIMDNWNQHRMFVMGLDMANDDYQDRLATITGYYTNATEDIGYNYELVYD